MNLDLKRRVLCGLLGVHVGHVESVSVDHDRHDLILTFMPCTRCGRLAPLELRPRHEVEGALGIGRVPAEEHR